MAVSPGVDSRVQLLQKNEMWKLRGAEHRSLCRGR